MPRIGVGQAELAIHQVDRDGDRDRRHHARRQDEEQQVVGFSGTLKREKA
jgi:hypothetical protein